MISSNVFSQKLALIFYSFIIFFNNTSSFKGEIRHLSTNKAFINRLGDGQFEVVHPFQIRDKNDRVGIDTRNYFLNGTVHYKQVTIVIRTASLGRLKLLLGLNELIFVNDSEFKKVDMSDERTPSATVENCYYQGTINGEDSSFVALSSCNGLRGVIAFSNGTAYGIWPLEGGDRGRRHPHILYHTVWSRKANSGGRTIRFVHNSGHLKRFTRRDVTRQTKYVELAIIGDHSFMKQHSLNDLSGIEFILEAVNTADLMLSRDLNVRLSVVYLEQWIDAQRIDMDIDIEKSLTGVMQYVTGHLYHIGKDATLLLTGEKFVNDDVTSSSFGGTCTARATGIFTAIDSFTVHETGQVLAYNLAHMLGIDSDSSDCHCEMGAQCLMYRQIGAPGAPFKWQFSSCAVARMHSILQSGQLQCLLNRPLEASPLKQCGNGIVDGEEECDCGQRESCLDPCCDPLTCTFRAHAQCAAHQPCCNRCQFRPAGHVCRTSRSICDVAEVCSGDSGDCPLDSYLIDGTVCGINGHCWKGNCSDIEQQCRALWGSNAVVASQSCFERNILGAEYANCGFDRDGNYRKCPVDNIRCGSLHCQDGLQSPLNQKHNSFNLHFIYEGKQIQCKMITDIEVGVVSDGTSCGSGRVCVQGSCLPLLQVSIQVSCPTNNLAYQCSGHGDCTTAQTCLCYEGWSGVACDTRINSSTIETTPVSLNINNLFLPLPVGRTMNTTTLLVVLLIVGIILLLLLICLLFCYRRRSNVEFSSPADEKLCESIPENTNRAIKFGNMPSYREEKRKRKKDKHVYDALHRMNETNEQEVEASVRNGNILDTASVLSYNRSIPVCLRKDANVNMNGSPASILKETNSSSRKIFINGSMYDRSPCSEIVASPSRCSAVTHSGFSVLYEKGRSGYATDSELGMSRHYIPRRIDTAQSDRSVTSSQGSITHLAATPLRLNNIGLLLRQLQYGDEMMNDAEMNILQADQTDIDPNIELCTIGMENGTAKFSSSDANDVDLYKRTPNSFATTDGEIATSFNRTQYDERSTRTTIRNTHEKCFDDEHLALNSDSGIPSSSVEDDDKCILNINNVNECDQSLFNDAFKLDL